jgi:iron complex outermembrane recepter protein
MVTGKQKNGVYIPFIPAHKVQSEVRAEKEKLLFIHNAFISVFLSTAFRQNNIAPDETPTESYTLLDLSLGGKFKIKNQLLSFSLSGNNLFDKKYIDHLSTLKEVGLFNPGRNIVLNIKIPFEVKNHEKRDRL